MMARPTAANGVSHGRMPVAIGSIRPAAPSTSATPIEITNGRARSENPIHFSRPRPMIFGAPAARKKSAGNPCTLHRTMFNISSSLSSHADNLTKMLLLLELVEKKVRDIGAADRKSARQAAISHAVLFCQRTIGKTRRPHNRPVQIAAHDNAFHFSRVGDDVPQERASKQRDSE